MLADELHLRGPKFGCGLGQDAYHAGELRHRVYYLLAGELLESYKAAVSTPASATTGSAVAA